MASTNAKRATTKIKTFEGARAMHEKPVPALERVMNAHMLWEDGFYLDGQTNAAVLQDAVIRAVAHDPFETGMAILRARELHNIRHAPLLAAVTYAKVGGPDARDLITNVITRADELAEVLAMAGGKKAPHAVMKGVKDAFSKFDEYQFGKYKGTGNQISLRDAVFLSHPNPKKHALVQKIVDDTLQIPNTWETRLSSGEDKQDAFTDLLETGKLGAMALLRNLRNMEQAGVDRKLVNDALAKANWARVLPFRFMSAALASPMYAPALDRAFQIAVSTSDTLPGATAVLLDTSGSMRTPISQKGTVQAYQAGAALAAAVRGQVDLYQWADRTAEMTNWQSLSSAMNIKLGQVGFGTNMSQAINFVNSKATKYDRLIVLTDMQFNDNLVPKLAPGQKGYTINLAGYSRPGLMHGDWTHVSGFSSAILKYITGIEV